jgi:hypothetical protein
MLFAHWGIISLLSRSGFSLECPSFTAVLNRAKDVSTEPCVLGPQSRICPCPPHHLSGSIWWQEKQARVSHVGDETLARISMNPSLPFLFSNLEDSVFYFHVFTKDCC